MRHKTFYLLHILIHYRHFRQLFETFPNSTILRASLKLVVVVHNILSVTIHLLLPEIVYNKKI